jgi:hypothetical protein
MGVKARLLTGLVIVAMTGDAVIAEIPFDPIDQRQVAVTADGRKRDQFFEKLSRTERVGHGALNTRCRWSE